MSKREAGSNSKRILVVAVLLLAVVVAGAVMFGPRAVQTIGRASGPGDIVIVPRDAAMVFSVNVKALRGAPIWKHVLELKSMSAEGASSLAELKEVGGLDPFTQIDSIFGAYPLNRTEGGEFGVIARGGPFDEQRLTTWSRSELRKEQRELVSKDYRGKKVWADHVDGRPAATLFDASTMLLAGNAWIEQMIDRATDPSAAPPNESLAPLLTKVNQDASVWGVGLANEEIRQRFRSDPRMAAAASITSAYVSVDLAKGLLVKGALVLGSESDAVAFNGVLNQLLGAFKLSPDLAMVGLTPILGAVVVQAKGAEVTVEVNLTQPQVDDLIVRAKALLSSAGAAGNAPPSMPLPIPSQPPQ